MTIVNFTPWLSLFGGILIGIAAILLMLMNGKIAGVSGIVKGLFTNQDRQLWRLTFLLGLFVGGLFIVYIMPYLYTLPHQLTINGISTPLLIVAGLLVGIGTAMGNGCTSGHGVCGLGRRSSRSLSAVLSFMTSGFITVFIMFHIVGVQ